MATAPANEGLTPREAQLMWDISAIAHSWKKEKGTSIGHVKTECADEILDGLSKWYAEYVL